MGYLVSSTTSEDSPPMLSLKDLLNPCPSPFPNTPTLNASAYLPMHSHIIHEFDTRTRNGFLVAGSDVCAHTGPSCIHTSPQTCSSPPISHAHSTGANTPVLSPPQSHI